MSIRGLYSGGAGDVVYFEHQKANTRLCGLHCLNNLLQGPEVEQAEMQRLGRELERLESRIASPTDAYAQASSDGYYGLDVMLAALQRRQISLKYFDSPEFRDLLLNPGKHGDAFILNLQDHWLAVRMVRGRWFSLDSLSTPEPISESRINSFVTSLKDHNWTLLIARPVGWPNAKLPEPAPKSHPKIPTLSAGPLLPAAYYTFEAVTRLADDASPAAAAPRAAPAQQRVSPRQHAWPEAGGRTLGAAAPPPAAGGLAEDDPELLETLRVSVADFKAGLKPPPPEPSAGGLMFKVTDMTDCGSRGRVLSRRFAPGATALDLYRWLFKSPEIWPGALQALGAMDRVVLAAQFPPRFLICERGASVRFAQAALPLPPPPGAGAVVTDAPLTTLFESGGESLRLVFAG